VVAYEVLCGDVPYLGSCHDVIRGGKLALNYPRGRDLPEGARSLIEDCMAPNPFDRLLDTKEIVKRLRKLKSTYGET